MKTKKYIKYFRTDNPLFSYSVKEIKEEYIIGANFH
jgi:hypothetical protein